MLRLIVITALMASGCANFVAKPYSERVTNNPSVTWKVVDDVQEECLKLGAREPGPLQRLTGCAVYNQKTCTIITARQTSMTTLGHELRHCFEGKFHE